MTTQSEKVKSVLDHIPAEYQAALFAYLETAYKEPVRLMTLGDLADAFVAGIKYEKGSNKV